MYVRVEPYNLPDFKVFTSEKLIDHIIWRPDKKYLVLGRSNKADKSLFLDKVEKDGVEVLQRPSGGETVLLSPNTLVISVKIVIGNILDTHQYFKIINSKIIKALSDLGIQNLLTKGISDISIGEKKILGSSIFREKEVLFYHSVLNVSESPEVIAIYLKHPSREPDYRKGRDHIEFITSIKAEGYNFDFQLLKETIQHGLNNLS